ncbi:MAG: hypothetical protein IPO15_24510 [Anaerolineae bacterium]|uniref:hypothetical protein n=1 Tax=Candidatus Amarolinea dominans TaxID=3140696 RepID=UPI00313622A9|nr:hypothetical protein [Anaerolineae bacterium]
MNTPLVAINTRSLNGRSRSVIVPVSVPDLDDVRALAVQLHHGGKSYQGRMWGWEVTYEPNSMSACRLKSLMAEIEMRVWAPASLRLVRVVSGFSLLGNGADGEPEP